MNSSELGKDIFRRMGCHPSAIEASKEGSSSVWLFAALCAKYQEQEDYAFSWGMSKGGLPVFMHPKLAPPDPPCFVGRNHHLHSEENSKELARMDGLTLERWLRWARKKQDVVSKYGFLLLLIGVLEGREKGVMRNLLTFYEAVA